MQIFMQNGYLKPYDIANYHEEQVESIVSTHFFGHFEKYEHTARALQHVGDLKDPKANKAGIDSMGLSTGLPKR